MMSYLDYDNPIAMGNNPYQQNRMKIDPRFRMAQGTCVDLSRVQGYSATGEVLLKGQSGITDQQNTQAQHAAQTWAAARTPQQEPRSHNELMNSISQIKALKSQPTPTQPQQNLLPNWRGAIGQQDLNFTNQPDLRQLNDHRYQQILGEKH